MQQTRHFAQIIALAEISSGAAQRGINREVPPTEPRTLYTIYRMMYINQVTIMVHGRRVRAAKAESHK